MLFFHESLAIDNSKASDIGAHIVNCSHDIYKNQCMVKIFDAKIWDLLYLMRKETRVEKMSFFSFLGMYMLISHISWMVKCGQNICTKKQISFLSEAEFNYIDFGTFFLPK